jgi:DtxR family transcriptional regulator, Mn-dependent transcriptional regulator
VIALTASSQKYLKAVYILSQKGGSIRVIDVAQVLSVSKSSAFKGLKKLAEKNLIAHEFYGDVNLTPEGNKKAKELSESYKSLLKRLGKDMRPPAGFEYLLDSPS